MMNNFVKMLDGGAGENYLFKYFAYQFYYWHDKDTRFGKGRVQLNWIIGQKAYDRYDINKEEHWRSYSTTLYEKFRIKKSELITPTDNNGWVLKSVEHEEGDKMIYHNTSQGLIFCVDYTSMYSPNSNACKTCTNSKDCISIMIGKYPTVYSGRMEGAK